jgi:hypothetical protein
MWLRQIPSDRLQHQNVSKTFNIMTFSNVDLIGTRSIMTHRVSIKRRYAECHYADGGISYCYSECHYAKSRYAKCHYGECRDPLR